MTVRRWLVPVCIIAVAAVLDNRAHTQSMSDPVTAWNELTIKTARVKRLNDVKLFRDSMPADDGGAKAPPLHRTTTGRHVVAGLAGSPARHPRWGAL